MRMFNQKYYGSMCKDQFFRVEQDALRRGDAWHLDTIRFFRNANEIYARYDEWKDNDRFYFIPLKLNMTYSISGHAIKMADDPIHLGTFIKNTFEHEDLFTAPCPRCGRKLYPYGYNGSPLSGRVDLEATCSCGWSKYVIVGGWRGRCEALKSTQKADKRRLIMAKLLHPKFKGATIEELLDFLRKE